MGKSRELNIAAGAILLFLWSVDYFFRRLTRLVAPALLLSSPAPAIFAWALADAIKGRRSSIGSTLI
jgi:hypothetical protein